ncbi:methylated-DNA--[protein]-cysteine S-methyltransferase [Anianabacter salinae]|uniref:methylated-DNA--[protein]-cysteine S-methyltransferase n=1 Tax=Anianabacter salinae TaxID=2851023 RepID=UPI00225E4CC7|nr:methylated-DNA--[protein]-cysteine S-methyltransferase [Anianabacter salinae]MBV0911635.1 methylated-DNA--[protein]-cysteine S-methyltransferase [Anianabacter salinae]
MNCVTVDTPVGTLSILGGASVQAVRWGALPGDPSPCLARAADEVRAYFAGSLTAFTVPLDPGGTEFQHRFLDMLLAIPFGETRRYGDLARALGVSAQAIGQACGANPIPVLIPCHRVLSASGLGGYSGAGGIETKVALLRHEHAAGLLI